MALALPSPAGNPRAGGPGPVMMQANMAGIAYDDESPIEQQEELKPGMKPVPVSTLVAWFEDAEEMTDTARRNSERDRDYYDNKQLTQEERRILEKRGQPAVVINRIQTKVNYLKGFEASQRADPRAFPRTPMDEEAAEAATDGLRYVADKSKLQQSFSEIWENLLVEGFGGLEIVPHPSPEGDAEFEIKVWPWDRLFYDPYSRRLDFSDARYLGGVIWMDYEEALEKWPTKEAADCIARTLEGQTNDTYDDRPSWKQWTANGKRRRVRICQIYYKRGEQWRWAIFTSGGIIQEGEVPYKDEDGRSMCPLIMQSAFVDRENARYGFVRALISPQDEINKRRSKMLHEATVRQFIYEDGAFADVDDIKYELARPDGGVKVNPGFRFEMIDRSKEIQAHTALQQEAKNEIDLMGPNSAMQGKGDKDSSGRAILANQQGGQIEIASLVDRHKHLKIRTYELIWVLIRTYWTNEKWVRVTDDENKSKFVGLNSPVMMAEKLLEMAEERGIDPEAAKQAMKAAIAQNPALAQELEQVVETKRVPAEMSMDIILEEVPDTANIQAEQFEQLTNLARAGVQFPPKVYLMASSLRNKKELLEVLESGEQIDPATAEANALALAKAKTEIEKMVSEIAKNEAAAIKTKVEADMMDAQVGQIVNPQIVDIGGGYHQMPDGSIMQGDQHGGLSPLAPALDPNQEKQRAFDAEQAERQRQTQTQTEQQKMAFQGQQQAVGLQAQDRSQQMELSARERAQQADQAHQSQQAEAQRLAEAQNAARAAGERRQPNLDQLYNGQ
jgi:hypothetical protein